MTYVYRISYISFINGSSLYFTQVYIYIYTHLYTIIYRYIDLELILFSSIYYNLQSIQQTVSLSKLPHRVSPETLYMYNRYTSVCYQQTIQRRLLGGQTARELYTIKIPATAVKYDFIHSQINVNHYIADDVSCQRTSCQRTRRSEYNILFRYTYIRQRNLK